MQQLISFINKNKHFLLFLLLEALAILFTIQSHSFHMTKFVNSANFITGGIYKKINNFKEFLLLKEENKRLSEENVRLLNTLASIDTANAKIAADSTWRRKKFRYISAKVINNEYNKSNNYLTLNKGKADGIGQDMGVINSKGVIGITKSVSDHYATVLSILNLNSHINVKMLNTDHFGSLSWNAKDYNIIQLEDLPVQSNIKVGDTVITGGMSTIFPEGIPVGTIAGFKVENNRYSFINVKLFNDMSALGYVKVIKNFDRAEIEELEKQTRNE